MLKTIALAVLSVLAVGLAMLAVYIGFNSYAMDSMVAGEVETLIRDSVQQTKPRTFSYNDLGVLPAPVQRYFRYALPDHSEPILYARIKLESEYKSPAFGNFGAFNAEEYLMAIRPGLIFDAVMWPAGAVWMDVRDKYYDGHAAMQINLFSGIPTLTEAGIPELDMTTLMRWAGDAVLAPHALLPGEHVRWDAVDENSAMAVITDGGKTGRILFQFNELGQIISYSSNDRFDRVGDRYRLSGSITYRDEYADFDGIKVPTTFRVSKILNGVPEEYFRGRVVAIEFVTGK